MMSIRMMIVKAVKMIPVIIIIIPELSPVFGC